MMKSLSKRVIIVTISSILINAISMFTMPIFTRIMSVEDYGIYSLFISWASILTIVLGLQTYGTINNAKIVFKEEYGNYCNNVLVLSVLSFAFGGFAIFLMRDLVKGILGVPKEVVWLLILYACGNFCITFITTFFSVDMKPQYNLFISVVVLVATVGLSILLILSDRFPGYFGRIVGQTVPYLVAMVGVILYFRCANRFVFQLSYWKYCLKLSVPLVLHGVSGLILDQSDRIMLGNYQGNEVVGIYSLAYTIALPISIIYGALNSAWTPQFYLLMSEKREAEICKHFGRQMFLVVCITIVYILISPEIVKVLAPEEYWIGIPLVPLIMVAYFFNFLYLFPVNYEFFKGNTKYIGLSSFISAIINIILNSCFIPILGMYGAAIATNISYIAIFVIHECVARRTVVEYSLKRRFYCQGILLVIVSIVWYYFFGDALLIRWVTSGVIIVILGVKVIKQKSLI